MAITPNITTGIKAIKVAKTDSFGNDQSLQLREADVLRIYFDEKETRRKLISWLLDEYNLTTIEVAPVFGEITAAVKPVPSCAIAVESALKASAPLFAEIVPPVTVIMSPWLAVPVV